MPNFLQGKSGIVRGAICRQDSVRHDNTTLNKLCKALEKHQRWAESEGQGARPLAQAVWKAFLDCDTNGAVELKALHRLKVKNERKRAKKEKRQAKKGRGKGER